MPLRSNVNSNLGKNISLASKRAGLRHKSEADKKQTEADGHYQRSNEYLLAVFAYRFETSMLSAAQSVASFASEHEKVIFDAKREADYWDRVAHVEPGIKIQEKLAWQKAADAKRCQKEAITLYKKAKQELEAAIQGNPQDAESHDGLGCVYMGLNLHTLARKHFLKAVSLQPDNRLFRQHLNEVEARVDGKDH